MEDDKVNYISIISVLVENELLNQIQEIYFDDDKTLRIKKFEREECIKQFVKKYANKFYLSENIVRKIVDIVIKRTKWIKEIEDMSEEEIER